MVFTPESLFYSWKDVSQGKHDIENQARFEFFLEPNLYALAHDLNADLFHPHALREKVIPYPKRRTAQVPSLVDKIVQHEIYDGYAYQKLSAPMVKSASANMRGRGDTYAIQLAKNDLHEFWKEHRRPPFILKGDVHSFFASIPHERTFELIDRYIDDADVRRIMKNFIKLTPEGLSLGIVQNQQLANLYLSEFDHIMKERFHCKYYGRHMDDWRIYSDSREELENILKWTEEYLGSIGLTLNPKTAITYRQFDFLGFSFIMTDTGKVIMRLQNSKRKAELKRLHKQVKQLLAGEITPEHLSQSYMGWREHASHGNTRNMILKMDERLSAMLMDNGYTMKVIHSRNRKGKKKTEVRIFANNQRT